MKAVIRSCKPYWLYLIINCLKKVEVGKTYPRSEDWNNTVYMYCSKDKKSFNRIPEEDRAWFGQFLGRVVCEFTCDNIEILQYTTQELDIAFTLEGGLKIARNYRNVEPFYNGKVATVHSTYLNDKELVEYGKGKPLYAWHISQLKIYDEPKELSEFYSAKVCGDYYNGNSGCEEFCGRAENNECRCGHIQLKRPPQSWQYCEELKESKNE